MSDIIKTQRSLAIKAKHNPTHKFDHLYRLICQEEWIHQALAQILSNQGARTAGIDGVTKKMLEAPEAYIAFITGSAARTSRETLSPCPCQAHSHPQSQWENAPAWYSHPQRPSGSNVTENGVGTDLGKRLPELLQRLPPWTQDHGLHRYPR